MSLVTHKVFADDEQRAQLSPVPGVSATHAPADARALDDAPTGDINGRRAAFGSFR